LLFRIQTPRVVGWALLRAVDAAQADAFRVLVVQDFECVAVEDGDDEAGKFCERGIGKKIGEKKEDETCQEQSSYHAQLGRMK
jgi:hypothetical protein